MPSSSHILKPPCLVVSISESQLCPPRQSHWETQLTTGSGAICSAANIVAIVPQEHMAYLPCMIPKVFLSGLTETT